MPYLVIGVLVLLLFLSGGARLRLPTWRIGSAVGALFAFAAAAFALVHDAWPAAIVLLVIGIWMAASARFPRRNQRERPAEAPPPGARDMSLAQARSILGVTETSSRKDIQAAYTRLMKRAHPDKGGSAGLAAQLNAARDRLLKG